MPKKYTDEEYQKILPKKQVGTAVLLFNSRSELLILKPDYRDGWLVPGGATDENESPLACALRETREEIGLELTDIELVCVYYKHRRKPHYADSMRFFYWGGVLTDEQISKISLQEDEIENYRFLKPEIALEILSESLNRCLLACLEAHANGAVAYLED
jgi:8-oxo-dGTP diphosphatase